MDFNIKPTISSLYSAIKSVFENDPPIQIQVPSQHMGPSMMHPSGLSSLSSVMPSGMPNINVINGGASHTLSWPNVMMSPDPNSKSHAPTQKEQISKTTQDFPQMKPAIKPLPGLHVSTFHPSPAPSTATNSYSLPTTSTHSPSIQSPVMPAGSTQSPGIQGPSKQLIPTPAPVNTTSLFPSSMQQQPQSPQTPVLQPPVIHPTVQDNKEKQMTITTVKNKLLQLNDNNYAKIKKDADGLLVSKAEIEQNSVVIESVIGNLAEKNRELEKTADAVGEFNEKLKAWIQQNGSNSQDEVNEVNIDKYVHPSDELAAKVLSTMAKEHAIEDCIFSLKKALEKETIPLEEFLQTIRNLSRKQFMCKLKVLKIQTYISKKQQLKMV